MIAVSHGYAWECQTQEGGWGLHGVFQDHAWKLRGVVNGIDYSEWNPTTDPHLKTGVHAVVTFSRCFCSRRAAPR
jgi:starch synthase